jgi:Flp pilus assembly protein TadD
VADYRWEQADHEFKNALSIDPSYVDARYAYAHMCLTPRRLYAESARVISDGLKYDPMSGTLNTELAAVKLKMGDIPAALDKYRESLARYPDAPGTLTGLAVALLTLGRLSEALQCLQHAQHLNPNDTLIASYLALCFVKLHRLSEADAVLQSVMRHSPLPNYTVATIYAALGKPNQAFEQLERAYLNRSSKLLWLQVDPRLESLRNDPRFARLVDKLHLTKYAPPGAIRQ